MKPHVKNLICVIFTLSSVSIGLSVPAQASIYPPREDCNQFFLYNCADGYYLTRPNSVLYTQCTYCRLFADETNGL